MTHEEDVQITNEASKAIHQRWTRIASIILAVLLVLIFAAVLVFKLLFVKPDLPTNDRSPSPSPTTSVDEPGSTNSPEVESGIAPKTEGDRKSEDYYTILILGRDTGGGGNTDTMLLASYDVTNQKATIMSIPRDTMVNVSWDVKKINSVYNWYGGGQEGIDSLSHEIAQLIGFEPDFRVVVEWEAVGEIVEAIGGVWFDVPYNMDYDDEFQDLSIHQEAGYRLLTGTDAMEVIRWRKNNPGSEYGYTVGIGDSGRMELQQDFLKSLIEQLLRPENIANINKIAKVFQQNVETDLTFQNLLWFGQQAVLGGLSAENVKFVTMPYFGAYAWSRSLGFDLAYVVPDPDKLLTLVNNDLSPFSEEFSLSDLDIMSVNADGSLSSSTGHVEDEKATYPKSHWLPEEEPEPEPEETTEPEPESVPTE